MIMLKIKINKKNILRSVSVFIFVLFAFSYGSFGVLIPFKAWVIILFLALLCMEIGQLQEVGRISSKVEIPTCLLAIMLIVMLFWNNYDYQHGAWYLEIYMSLIFIFFIIANNRNCTISTWIKTAIMSMIMICIFHAVSTLVSYVSRDFYTNIIYPIVDRFSVYSLIQQYNQGYMAGFTSHYSINGMFLSAGICMVIGYYFFRGNSKTSVKFKYWLILILLITALLLTGKRGPIIYVAFSFIIVYYVYNSNRQLSRYFKVIAIAIITLLCVYIASFFIPEITNVVERFIEQKKVGDITTGRLDLWKLGYSAFLENPILGKGWCWFRYHNPFGTEFYVHNVYLQWLCETGIIGSIPFLAFTFILYRHNYILLKSLRVNKLILDQNATRLLSASLMYQSFFIALSFTGTAFYEVQSLLPYMICCVITEYYWRRARNENGTRFKSDVEMYSG